MKRLGDRVAARWSQPVCYASKGLTEVEQRYSNIEREVLGVVWGLERFHYFMYGKKCSVHTYHNPLEAIFKKKLSSCPARLQRFMLRALKYDVTVTYVKGAQVPVADAISRLSPQQVPHKSQLPQLDIHCITCTLPASSVKLEAGASSERGMPAVTPQLLELSRGAYNQRLSHPQARTYTRTTSP